MGPVSNIVQSRHDQSEHSGKSVASIFDSLGRQTTWFRNSLALRFLLPEQHPGRKYQADLLQLTRHNNVLRTTSLPGAATPTTVLTVPAACCMAGHEQGSRVSQETPFQQALQNVDSRRNIRQNP
jgi:hypothetical protein